MVKLTKQGYCAVLKTNIFHTLNLELPAATVIVIIQIFIKHHTAAKVSQILHVKYPALSQLYAALNIWLIVFAKYVPDTARILMLVQQAMH